MRCRPQKYLKARSRTANNKKDAAPAPVAAIPAQSSRSQKDWQARRRGRAGVRLIGGAGCAEIVLTELTEPARFAPRAEAKTAAPAKVSVLSSPSRRFSQGADIHSHPLPAIDDGSRSLEESLQMLRLAARYGTSLLVATPHRYWQGRENTPDLLRRLTAQVQDALAQTRFSHRIALLPGQEIPLRPETGAELAQGTVLTLGDTGVYALVEPPFDNLPDWTVSALAAIVKAGFRPVLAHPERNAVIQTDPARVQAFVEAGAVLQLTAMSVTGDNGKSALATARWILERGLATVIASDTHSPDHRPPTMRAAYHAVASQFGTDIARALCINNPRAIAMGQEIKQETNQDGNASPAPSP